LTIKTFGYRPPHKGNSSPGNVCEKVKEFKSENELLTTMLKKLDDFFFRIFEE
jgi:hypothetical protein